MRRAGSWLLSAGLIWAGLATWQRIPGAGGVRGELGWLLAAGGRTDLNRAGALLWVVDERRPGAAGEVCRELLVDDNPLVVERTLGLLVDLLPRAGAAHPEIHEGLTAAARAWLARASSDEKVRVADAAARLVFALLNGRFYANTWDIALDPPQAERAEFAESDTRWMLAVITSRDPQLSSAGLTFLLSMLGEREDAAGIGERVRRVRAAAGAGTAGGAMREWPRVSVGPRGERLLVASLADPAPRVRWGAGLVLAACRDERGAAAVREWLRDDRQAPRALAAALVELFGPAE